MSLYTLLVPVGRPGESGPGGWLTKGSLQFRAEFDPAFRELANSTLPPPSSRRWYEPVQPPPSPWIWKWVSSTHQEYGPAYWREWERTTLPTPSTRLWYEPVQPQESPRIRFWADTVHPQYEPAQRQLEGSFLPRSNIRWYEAPGPQDVESYQVALRAQQYFSPAYRQLERSFVLKTHLRWFEAWQPADVESYTTPLRFDTALFAGIEPELALSFRPPTHRVWFAPPPPLPAWQFNALTDTRLYPGIFGALAGSFLPQTNIEFAPAYIPVGSPSGPVQTPGGNDQTQIYHHFHS